MGPYKLTAVIRADASVNIGMGHRVRCEVLAHEFVQNDISVLFVVHESCRAFALESDVLIERESQWDAIAQQADIVVLDHYGYDAHMTHRLYQLNPNLLVLDDNNNRGDLYCRWLLNPLSLIYSHTVRFPFIGGQYALLRPQFGKVRALTIQSPSKLLITFGGTDPLSLTLPVINSLFQRGFAAEDMLVMVGSSVRNIKEVEDFCRCHTIELHIATTDVAELMARSRYAISAAGGTLFELACMGVPTHFIQVADNQKNALEEHVALGWCSATDMISVPSAQRVDVINDVVDQVLLAWQSDLEPRRALAKNLVDGLGAQRVVATILEQVTGSSESNV